MQDRYDPAKEARFGGPPASA